MAKRNIILHCYKPNVNTDKVYLCCIRESLNESGETIFTVLVKWARRNNKLQVQGKGTFGNETDAVNCQMNYVRQQLKDGYKDVESAEYKNMMAPVGFAVSSSSLGIVNNLETEDGAAPATAIGIEWTCDGCGMKYSPGVDKNGIPFSSEFCPKCIDKIKAAKAKADKGNEDQVLICVDNAGMEDRFDLGIEYLVEDHTDKSMVYVYDKMGRKDEYFRSRFTTTEQWEKKNGKMKVNLVKNRESDPKAPKVVFMPLTPGAVKIQNILPNSKPNEPKTHFIPPTSSKMPTRSHLEGVA
jgi:predicted DNA-binding WGR domain protein